VLELLEALPAGVTIGDVWYNGYQHLAHSSLLGAVQGERLSALLGHDVPGRQHLPWIQAFDGNAVVIPDAGPLPQRTLPGGFEITLLSPTPEKLARLLPKWEAEVRKAGLVPGQSPQRGWRHCWAFAGEAWVPAEPRPARWAWAGRRAK
jgi:hypothetical protein